MDCFRTVYITLKSVNLFLEVSLLSRVTLKFQAGLKILEACLNKLDLAMSMDRIAPLIHVQGSQVWSFLSLPHPLR